MEGVDERFICPECGRKEVEVIHYDHAWEWDDDCGELGLDEDQSIVVYHCLGCDKDVLIEIL
jgi:transcription elongation factor Elf1